MKEDKNKGDSLVDKDSEEEEEKGWIGFSFRGR